MMDHSEIVKNLHKSLRVKVKEGQDAKKVWDDLIANKSTLKTYSESMKTLAQEDWDKNCVENRIKWIHHTCLSYFNEGGLHKMVRRKEKTRLFEVLRNSGKEDDEEERRKIQLKVESIEMPWKSVLCEKFFLLDVGSCFNPFEVFIDYEVIPIDISPASTDVLYCDFLNTRLFSLDDGKRLSLLDNELILLIKEKLESNNLIQGVFDIVVFSLLLSYFPTAAQRLQCCINAHQALQLNGLLVIVTPDSSHQNRHVAMMKSWKYALESIGFTRYKYEKLQHLHCMAYQKSCIDLKTSDEDLSGHMYIPQDYQEIDVKQNRKRNHVPHDSGSDSENNSKMLFLSESEV